MIPKSGNRFSEKIMLQRCSNGGFWRALKLSYYLGRKSRGLNNGQKGKAQKGQAEKRRPPQGCEQKSAGTKEIRATGGGENRRACDSRRAESRRREDRRRAAAALR